MSEIVDLDALIPSKVSVKIGDEVIEVLPPKMSDVLKLGKAGSKLKDLESLNENEIDETLKHIRDNLDKLIPQLQGKELNTAQMMKLVEIINDMTLPPEKKELDSKGLSQGDNDPKA